MVAAPASAAAQAGPIPGPLDGPLPRFTGSAVSAQPLRGPWRPANPALAPDGRNGSGLTPGNTAATPLPGPLGRGTTRSSAVNLGTCSSLAFDKKDRLLAVCNGPMGATLKLVDPVTLANIATLALPPRSGAPAKPTVSPTDPVGGTHFVVRADGTLLLPTTQSKLIVVTVGDASLTQTGAVDLSGVLESGERVLAVGAGFDGRDWVAGTAGTVAAVPRDGSAPARAVHLHEPIFEDLATDLTGTYVVTSRALYRLGVTSNGTPRVVWRQAVPLATAPDQHNGRLHDGSGTPPVMVAGGFVAVADARNPAHLLVARVAGKDSRRLACSVPLFAGSNSSVEAPLVAAGRSVVVANAYGYDSLAYTEGGRTTTGGIARVVVGKRGCRTAWTIPTVSPSSAGAVSRATGLLYIVEKPKGFPDAWNLAAIDWRTGKKPFTVLAGEGLGFNSDGGAVILGPDGAAYAGSFGGISRWKDN